ncbi:MAG: heme-binding protein [Betaproteobacteria bacterium]|nr:heme-binding protein [Betaproteobacteria bacterium]
MWDIAARRQARWQARPPGKPSPTRTVTSSSFQISLFWLEAITRVCGGMLIRDEQGEVIGAGGITGDTQERDEELAAHGIHAAGLKTDEDCAHLGPQVRKSQKLNLSADVCAWSLRRDASVLDDFRIADGLAPDVVRKVLRGAGQRVDA